VALDLGLDAESLDSLHGEEAWELILRVLPHFLLGESEPKHIRKLLSL
jgi:hypothetical protein